VSSLYTPDCRQIFVGARKNEHPTKLTTKQSLIHSFYAWSMEEIKKQHDKLISLVFSCFAVIFQLSSFLHRMEFSSHERDVLFKILKILMRRLNTLKLRMMHLRTEIRVSTSCFWRLESKIFFSCLGTLLMLSHDGNEILIKLSA
jgi:hypothetical protein